MFGTPKAGSIDYSQTLELDLATVVASLAGPKRPQDRIELPKMKESFNSLFSKPTSENGFNQPADKLTRRYPTKLNAAPRPPNDNALRLPGDGGQPQNVVEMVNNRPTQDPVTPAGPKPLDIGNGDVLIAAITSCTNTSNPGVLLAAGPAREKRRQPRVSPSSATSRPRWRRARAWSPNTSPAQGLLEELEKLNFYLAGYGCTTCIGNSGPLDPSIEETITQNDLICAAVLSGNRNFEARIHPNIKANFLASPPLVVAYAIAGRANIDLSTEPIGTGRDGNAVYLRDVWPTSEEIGAVMQYATDPATYRRLYGDFHQGKSVVERDPDLHRPGLRVAHIDLHRRAARSSSGFRCSRRRCLPCAARARWAFSVTRSPPTTSVPQARSSRLRPPASICSSTTSAFPISTATAAAAAITR
jgi:aconitate hydratase